MDRLRGKTRNPRGLVSGESARLPSYRSSYHLLSMAHVFGLLVLLHLHLALPARVRSPLSIFRCCARRMDEIVFHTERNHYDRLVHFSFGLFFTYPAREILMRKAGLRGHWLNILPIFTTLALSAAYEILEAIVASIVDPADAAAFLGSQGDQWDSQEDMSMALLGAVVSMTVTALVSRRAVLSNQIRNQR